MTEFNDEAPIPRYSGMRYIDPPEYPLEDSIERLMDSLGITKRRHLRTHIRWLIADAVNDAEDNYENS